MAKFAHNRSEPLMRPFNETLDHLRHRLQHPLPGVEAQRQMAPYNRPSGKEAVAAYPNARLSAVMALLYPVEDVAHFVLILRNAYPGVHSQQVSFPGGKKEPYDRTLVDTAKRETCEEIGVLPEAVEVLAPLTPLYIPPSNFLVHPYLGFTTEEPQFRPDPKEVQRLITVPLHQITDRSIVQEAQIPVNGGKMQLKAPYFALEGQQVWGATAMMISELRALL